MVQPVRANHKRASDHGNRYLTGVGRQLVTKPCRSCNATKASKHQEQDGAAPVPAEPGNQRNRAEERDQNGETAMHALIRRQKMGKDRRE
jgi:hypothetical protein